jgi:hypothetical protein
MSARWHAVAEPWKHVDATLKVRGGEREEARCLPVCLSPSDWRVLSV